MNSGYFVYVLQSQSNRLYIGITDNVSHRLEQHNAGISKWTRGKGSWRLIWKKVHQRCRKHENLNQSLNARRAATDSTAVQASPAHNPAGRDPRFKSWPRNHFCLECLATNEALAPEPQEGNLKSLESAHVPVFSSGWEWTRMGRECLRRVPLHPCSSCSSVVQDSFFLIRVDS
jgi:predicted GIY-YIG superfamily endonuclease